MPEQPTQPCQVKAAERDAALTSLVTQLGLTVDSTFIPFSRSRNSAEKYPSLNWHVRLMHNGREVLATDYSAGMAYCPSYKPGRLTTDKFAAIRHECEHGKRAWPASGTLLLDPLDVIASLALDAGVLDHPTYEDWADDSGYDSDSRSGEKIYRQCLEIALKLRAALGDNALEQLRTLANER